MRSRRQPPRSGPRPTHLQLVRGSEARIEIPEPGLLSEVDPEDSEAVILGKDLLDYIAEMVDRHQATIEGSVELENLTTAFHTVGSIAQTPNYVIEQYVTELAIDLADEPTSERETYLRMAIEGLGMLPSVIWAPTQGEDLSTSIPTLREDPATQDEELQAEVLEAIAKTRVVVEAIYSPQARSTSEYIHQLQSCLIKELMNPSLPQPPEGISA